MTRSRGVDNVTAGFWRVCGSSEPLPPSRLLGALIGRFAEWPLMGTGRPSVGANLGDATR